MLTFAYIAFPPFLNEQLKLLCRFFLNADQLSR